VSLIQQVMAVEGWLISGVACGILFAFGYFVFRMTRAETAKRVADQKAREMLKEE